MNRSNQLSLDLPEYEVKKKKVMQITRGNILSIFLKYTGFILL